MVFGMAVHDVFKIQSGKHYIHSDEWFVVTKIDKVLIVIDMTYVPIQKPTQ